MRLGAILGVGLVAPSIFSLPTSVSGLKFWWPSQNINHSGSNCTSITDASGNGNGGTMVGTVPYAAAELDGYAAASYNGGVNYFTLPNTFTGLTQGEIFFVTKGSASGNGSHNLELDGAGQSLYPFAANGHIYEGFGNDTRPDTGAPIISITAAYRLYNARITTGKVLSTYLNNSLQYSGSVTTVGFGTHPAIGASGGGTFNTFATRKDAEVFMFDHVLSTSDRAVVLEYVAKKFPTLGL